MNQAVDDEDPSDTPMSNQQNTPRPERRQENQDTTTRGDLPSESVQPGINESSDDPN